jgi:hypothetical protein
VLLPLRLRAAMAVQTFCRFPDKVTATERRMDTSNLWQVLR